MTLAKELQKDNHYVPQVYLKRWADSSDHAWVYRVLVSHQNVPLWRRTSIKGIAYHSHLYTRHLPDGITDEYEKWLNSEFENPAAGVIQKVANESRLTPEDWADLVRFAAAQDLRTPARLMEMLHRWEKTLPELMENTLKESVQEIEKIRREGKPLNRTGFADNRHFPMKVTTELLPGAEHGTLRAELIAGRSLYLLSLREQLTTTLKALLAHKWTILHSPQGVRWLTSDDPVIKLGSFEKRVG